MPFAAPFGHAVHAAAPGPDQEPAAQMVQLTAPAGSKALEPGGSPRAPPAALHEPSTALRESVSVAPKKPATHSQAVTAVLRFGATACGVHAVQLPLPSAGA